MTSATHTPEWSGYERPAVIRVDSPDWPGDDERIECQLSGFDPDSVGVGK